MTTIVLVAILPIAALICLGAAFHRFRFLEDAFWPQAERLGYFVLLPALLFNSLATADLGSLPLGDMAATLICSTIGVAALVLALRPIMGIDGPAFTSVFQGSIRFNNYVGVSLCAGLFGTKGIALAAICNAAIVPTVNVICVLVFARYGSLRFTGRGLAQQLLVNPLLISSLSGLVFQLLGLQVPSGVDTMLKTLGAASLPLGLMCIGAALNFSAARKWIVPIAASSAIKFCVMPVATLLVGRLVGLSGPAMSVTLVFQALPCATSAYITARQLGGDAPLMAAITAIQTILAAVAIPAVLFGLSAWIP